MQHPETPHNGAAGHAHTAEVHPLHDASGVACQAEVELVVFRFNGFGRLAHFRRWLTTLPEVHSARIANYGRQTASFELAVSPGTTSGSLVLPGTRLIGSDGRRVELCVEPA